MEYIKVGQITGTRGLKGELKVASNSHFKDERFAVGQKLFVGTEKKELKIKKSSSYKGIELLVFENLEDINLVEKFIKAELFVDIKSLNDLAHGEFYYHELIGLEVYSLDDEFLGHISQIMETGANDVWRIKLDTRKKDLLIPYIDLVVKEVDIKNKRVTIDLIEGLL